MALNILSLSQSKSCFRLFICDDETKTLQLQLRVVNWTTMLQSNNVNKEMLDDVPTLLPVVKLFYLDCRVRDDLAEKFVLKQF